MVGAGRRSGGCSGLLPPGIVESVWRLRDECGIRVLIFCI
jgi:hypothetical protein